MILKSDLAPSEDILKSLLESGPSPHYFNNMLSQPFVNDEIFIICRNLLPSGLLALGRRVFKIVKHCWLCMSADAFHPPLSLLISAVEVVQKTLHGLAEDKACTVSLLPLEYL